MNDLNKHSVEGGRVCHRFDDREEDVHVGQYGYYTVQHPYLTIPKYLPR